VGGAGRCRRLRGVCPAPLTVDLPGQKRPAGAADPGRTARSRASPGCYPAPVIETRRVVAKPVRIRHSPATVTVPSGDGSPVAGPTAQPLEPSRGRGRQA